MATDLGKITWRPMGEFNLNTEYEKYDVVSYENTGSSYVSLQSTIGNIPTNTAYWMKISYKGDRGEQGIQGIQGNNGLPGSLLGVAFALNPNTSHVFVDTDILQNNAQITNGHLIIG